MSVPSPWKHVSRTIPSSKSSSPTGQRFNKMQLWQDPTNTVGLLSTIPIRWIVHFAYKETGLASYSVRTNSSFEYLGYFNTYKRHIFSRMSTTVAIRPGCAVPRDTSDIVNWLAHHCELRISTDDKRVWFRFISWLSRSRSIGFWKSRSIIDVIVRTDPLDNRLFS